MCYACIFSIAAVIGAILEGCVYRDVKKWYGETAAVLLLKLIHVNTGANHWEGMNFHRNVDGCVGRDAS